MRVETPQLPTHLFIVHLQDNHSYRSASTPAADLFCTIQAKITKAKHVISAVFWSTGLLSPQDHRFLLRFPVTSLLRIHLKAPIWLNVSQTTRTQVFEVIGTTFKTNNKLCIWVLKQSFNRKVHWSRSDYLKSKRCKINAENFLLK